MDIPVMSHPVWVRGLKRFRVVRRVVNIRVAPRVGAWIETHGKPGRLDVYL